MSMCYFDFPQEKIDLFEPSQKNYYFESGSKYSYLCSQEEISTVNFMDDFTGKDGGGYVITEYLRCSIIENGKIIFENPNCVKISSKKYIIVSDKAHEYTVKGWNEKLVSHDLRSDKTGDSALHPIYYESYGEAISIAKRLSLSNDCKYLVSMYLDYYDRH